MAYDPPDPRLRSPLAAPPGPLPTYPERFPLADSDAYSIAVNMGLLRSGMELGNTRQRRIFRHMPHVLQLGFHLSTAELYDWQYWVNLNAYDWFLMPLADMFAPPAQWSPDGIQPRGQISPQACRFISDLTIALAGYDRFAVTVQAELGPWLLSQLPQPPAEAVIDATGPDTADEITDILDARFADSPAADGLVDAGTPGRPSLEGMP
jgi:hypothetical protein